MRKPTPIMTAALCLLPQPSAALASGSESKSGGGDLHLVPMDELQVPIIDGNRADGQLSVKLVLEAKDAATADRATKMLPALRATSVASAIEFARLYASPMMPVDAAKLANEMSDALRHQDPGIARVLVVEVSARSS